MCSMPFRGNRSAQIRQIMAKFHFHNQILYANKAFSPTDDDDADDIEVPSWYWLLTWQGAGGRAAGGRKGQKEFNEFNGLSFTALGFHLHNRCLHLP